MIDYSLDKQTSILHVRPTGPLGKGDFDRLATAVDPFIDEAGGLAGLILEVGRFPGWEDFGAAVRHFHFVRDHHRKIRRIAVVTDSLIGTLAEHLTTHFVAAQIRRFDADQLTAAVEWISGAE